MAKFNGDVRPLSNNPAYMGVIFEGEIDQAIAQARAAQDHGLAEQFVPKGMNRNRAALLQHLNLLGLPKAPAIVDDDIQEPPGKYTVEYAQSRGWLNGPAKLAMELDPSN
jgi:hypothetical protein